MSSGVCAGRCVAKGLGYDSTTRISGLSTPSALTSDFGDLGSSNSDKYLDRLIVYDQLRLNKARCGPIGARRDRRIPISNGRDTKQRRDRASTRAGSRDDASHPPI